LRWSELGIQTLREATHPPLVRAGYVSVEGEFTALGERLLARWFPSGVEPRTTPPAARLRARQKLLAARSYWVAPGADVPAELDAVADGGRVLAPSAHGDEAFGRCAACGYQGTEIGWETGAIEQDEPLVEHHTPDCPGIEAVVAHFADRGLTAAGMLKCYAAGDTVVLVPGDRQVRRPPPGEPPPGLPVGYIGPMGLQGRGLRVLADRSVAARPGPRVTGANRPEHHVTGCTLGRDFTVDEFGPFAAQADGDPCPACGAALVVVPAFEVRSEAGTVGASRVVGLLAERCRDEAGLVWPPALAPFATHVVALRGAEEAAAALDGPDVLWDDRDASPGVKFADADLIGLPVQVVIGPKSLARGVVERKHRATGERTEEAWPPVR
jgi:prolyl-tRNA synthetase